MRELHDPSRRLLSIASKQDKHGISNGTSCVCYGPDRWAFQRYRRRDTALFADHLAYDVLSLSRLFISFFPRSRVPRARIFPFVCTNLAFVLLARDIKTRSSTKSELCMHLSGTEWFVWALLRPMQRARASRVTVTNENTHSLVSRTRGTHHCAFLLFLLPLPRLLLSPHITIDAAVCGEIEDTADVTTP